MKNYVLFFTIIGLAFLVSCSKNNDLASSQSDRISLLEDLKNDVLSSSGKQGRSYRVDLSIIFAKYKKGQLYKNDTIWNEFIIKNNSNETIKKGDTLKVSCDINGQEYDLRLERPNGQTALVLDRDLPRNGVFRYNPGYLLGRQSREYLKTDRLVIGLRVYGVNNARIDYPKFSSDPNPKNNRAELVNTKDGSRVTK